MANASLPALAVLTQSIKGYRGYQESVQRAESDSELRAFLILKIEGLLEHLQHLPETTGSEQQNRLDQLAGSAQRKLRTVCESLSRPTYQGGLFFKTATVQAEVLSRIYSFENGMIRDLDKLAEEITVLSKAPALDEEIYEEAFVHIHDFVDNFNQSLFEREALIAGDMEE